MKLKALIKNLKYKEIVGKTDLEIKEIKTDSNSVVSGSLFICLKGKDFDGHGFIRQVEKYGAVAIISEKKLETTLTQIIVDNSRSAMSIIASEFYGRADKKMKMIAVLGTNGKTTTSHVIRNIFEKSGVKCGLIGTLGTFYGNESKEPTLTTPDPLELHKTLKEMYDSGVETVVMEVSAHAVYLDKVKGLKFAVGVFTNFSQDHLDFFGDMNEYKQAKLKFFKENECQFIVTNSDDEVGREILKIKPNAISYGIVNPADVFAIDVKNNDCGSEYVINLFDCVYNVKIELIGEFNVYNTLAAASATALMGVKTSDVIYGLKETSIVSGRLENVYDGKFKIYIDYAHTPDGLEKVLVALKKIAPKRLICLFGCGGNRDKEKRKIMGQISAKNSDFTVITSDNPRFEDPMEIINEIETGVIAVSKNYIAIENREEAIKYAINILKVGDVLLIAGKGSEKYQEILGIKKPYCDKDTIVEYLRGEYL